MTTKPSITTTQPDNYVRLPDAPKPEDMNNVKYLHLPGNTHHLAEHLGNPDTTIISGEAYISREPTGEQRGLMAPDLLIAFKVNPEANVTGTATSSRNRASRRTSFWKSPQPAPGRRDATSKREGYAGLGIPEYWRFDHTGGQHHGAPLAGDRLEGGSYQPIPVERPLTSRPSRATAPLTESVPSLGTGPTGMVRPGHGAAHSAVQRRAGPSQRRARPC